VNGRHFSIGIEATYDTDRGLEYISLRWLNWSDYRFVEGALSSGWFVSDLSSDMLVGIRVKRDQKLLFIPEKPSLLPGYVTTDQSIKNTTKVSSYEEFLSHIEEVEKVVIDLDDLMEEKVANEKDN
jgi:membrane glycosyltransferase